MRSKIILIIILTCFCFAETKVEDRYLLKRSIVDIKVTGNHILSEADILDQANISTAIGRRLETQTLQEDLKKIFSLGIFQVVDYRYESFKSGVRLIFVVKENPIINEIKFRNNKAWRGDELKKVIYQKEREIFNFNYAEEDIKLINSLYKKRGFSLSSISQVNFKENNDLEIIVNEPIVNEITITGNNYTKDYLLLREFSTKKGDVYNARVMQEDRKRLFSLGYFSKVSIPKIVPSDEEDMIDVKVTVTEKKKNRLNFGGGIASDEQFGFVKLKFINIFNTGEQLTLRLQTGQLRSFDKSSYKFRYYNPWFLNRNFSLGYTKYFVVSYEKLRNASTDIDNDILPITRDGFDIDCGWTLPFGKRYKFILQYTDEYVRESSLYPRITYFKKSLAAVYKYNGLEYDIKNVITSGESIILRYEKGGTIGLPFGGNFELGKVDFSKFDLGYAHFTSLSAKSVFGFRARSGVFVPSGEDNILEGEEFSVGGGNTVRGYSDLDPFAIGSKMFILNLEYRHFITDWIQGVVFYDWGNAYTDVNLSPKEFKAGAGLGLRFSTPIGPIRFDWGRGEEFWIFHFGLGQSF